MIINPTMVSSASVAPVNYHGSLGWLIRHQSRDGRWSARFWDACCDFQDPPTSDNPYRNDIAYTSLALLCFFGSGYDHKVPGKYKKHIERGMYWLIKQQASDGSWSDQTLVNALAVMATAEAYAMTIDSRLKMPAQNGVNYINAQLVPNTHNGVSCLLSTHTRHHQRADLLATNWCIFALKTAKSASLDSGNKYHELRAHYPTYVERIWQSKHYIPRFPDQDTQNTDTIFTSHCLAAFYFLGKRVGEPALETLHANAFKTWQAIHSEKKTVDPGQSYFMSLSFFQYGGDNWKTFAKVVQSDPRYLFDSTHCNASSIDPNKISGPYNRFEASVFSILSSMIYYRVRTRLKPKP